MTSGLIMVMSKSSICDRISTARFLSLFTQLRRMDGAHDALRRKIEGLEQRYDAQFEAVLAALGQLLEPEKEPPRKIGFTAPEKRKPYGGRADCYRFSANIKPARSRTVDGHRPFTKWHFADRVLSRNQNTRAPGSQRRSGPGFFGGFCPGLTMCRGTFFRRQFLRSFKLASREIGSAQTSMDVYSVLIVKARDGFKQVMLKVN